MSKSLKLYLPSNETMFCGSKDGCSLMQLSNIVLCITRSSMWRSHFNPHPSTAFCSTRPSRGGRGCYGPLAFRSYGTQKFQIVWQVGPSKVLPSSKFVTQININPRRAGGGRFYAPPPSGFSQISQKRRRCAPPFLAHLIIHLFRIGCQNFSSRSSKVRSPGQVK